MIRRLFDIVTGISLLLRIFALVSYNLLASADGCPVCGTMIPHPPAPDIAEDLLPWYDAGMGRRLRGIPSPSG